MLSDTKTPAADWQPEAAQGGGNATATVEPAPIFNKLAGSSPNAVGAVNDIDLILDIPVQLTVELGRTKIPIRHILQLAQGEVVVVNEKFGIRLTDIVTPSERMRKLNR